MAGAPLGNPLGGVLKQGDRLLAFYETDVVWHARLLLALVDQNLWVILTPDGDIYAEEVSDGNMDGRHGGCGLWVHQSPSVSIQL